MAKKYNMNTISGDPGPSEIKARIRNSGQNKLVFALFYITGNEGDQRKD